MRKVEIEIIRRVKCPAFAPLDLPLGGDQGCVSCTDHHHIAFGVVYCKWEETDEHTNPEREESEAASQKTDPTTF